MPTSGNVDYRHRVCSDFNVPYDDVKDVRHHDVLWKYLMLLQHEKEYPIFPFVPHSSWLSDANAKEHVDAFIKEHLTKFDMSSRKIVMTGTLRGEAIGSFDASVGECRIEKVKSRWFGYIGSHMISSSVNRKIVESRFSAFGRSVDESV